jgi:hypothetical protein
MEKSFPIEEVVYNGEKYINMKSDVFYLFFLEVVKYKNISESLLNEINKRYKQAKMTKRKRIRFKKEKEVLTVMYNILFEDLLK